jgi:hypothetical protein
VILLAVEGGVLQREAPADPGAQKPNFPTGLEASCHQVGDDRDAVGDQYLEGILGVSVSGHADFVEDELTADVRADHPQRPVELCLGRVDAPFDDQPISRQRQPRRVGGRGAQGSVAQVQLAADRRVDQAQLAFGRQVLAGHSPFDRDSVGADCPAGLVRPGLDLGRSQRKRSTDPGAVEHDPLLGLATLEDKVPVDLQLLGENTLLESALLESEVSSP